jgi:hypothetical protein
MAQRQNQQQRFFDARGRFVLGPSLQYEFGPRATDGPACCIWTSYFHGGSSQTILQALQAKATASGATVVDGTAGTVTTKPDVVVAVIGEPSYTQ